MKKVIYAFILLFFLFNANGCGMVDRAVKNEVKGQLDKAIPEMEQRAEAKYEAKAEEIQKDAQAKIDEAKAKTDEVQRKLDSKNNQTSSLFGSILRTVVVVAFIGGALLMLTKRLMRG